VKLLEIDDMPMEINNVSPVSYTKSWEEAKDDPWLIFHTWGTTGTFQQYPRSEISTGCTASTHLHFAGLMVVENKKKVD
jgi:hypothetical protein